MEEEWKALGVIEGWEVQVCYANEGPNLMEAVALYRELTMNPVYRQLAEAAGKEQ